MKALAVAASLESSTPALDSALALNAAELTPNASSAKALQALPSLPTLAELYTEHAALVWRMVRRFGVRPADVADQTQEVFLVAHRRLETFAGGSSKAWLIAIARRVAADYRKKSHIQLELLSEAPEPHANAHDGQLSAEVDARRARRMLDVALDALPEEKRVAFVLFELEQLRVVEIAEVLECPVQTIYSRIQSAREIVQRALVQYRAGTSAGGKP